MIHEKFFIPCSLSLGFLSHKRFLIAISLIVFSGEAKFKTEMPDNVVRGGEDYINYILILEYKDIIPLSRNISRKG